MKEETMNALVVYDSQYGNTERIAHAIADAFGESGEVRVVLVSSVHPAELQGVDLLVVGCPTQGWRPTPAVRSFLEGIHSDELSGLAVACFDTRFRMPRWMTGSAAGVMEEKLRDEGVPLLVPPESFFVKGRRGPLRSGALDRASTWARMLIKEVQASHPATP
jgi:flavodoxin